MKKKGFALIEIVMYITLGTLIIGTFSTVMIQEYKSMKNQVNEYGNNHNALNAFLFIENEVNNSKVLDVTVNDDKLVLKVFDGSNKTYEIKKREGKLVINRWLNNEDWDNKSYYNTILEKIHKIEFKEEKNLIKVTLWLDENYKEVRMICQKRKVVY